MLVKVSKAAGVGRPFYLFLSKNLAKSSEEFIWSTHVCPASKATETNFLPWAKNFHTVHDKGVPGAPGRKRQDSRLGGRMGRGLPTLGGGISVLW